MPSPHRNRVLWPEPNYYEKVLFHRPIAYWPLWEATDAVAYELINSAQNGAHVGVTLGQEGIGDGRTCPYYDGALDTTNIYSLTFANAFNGNEGSVIVWAKVRSSTVWADAAERRGFQVAADASNYVILRKNAAANQLAFLYRAGAGVLRSVNITTTSVSWMAWGMTWSVTNNQTYFFFNGVQQGPVQAASGVWAGLPAVGQCAIGSGPIGPVNVWDGFMAHGAVYNYPLPPSAMVALAMI